MPDFRSKINQTGIGNNVVVGSEDDNFRTSGVSEQQLKSLFDAPVLPTGDDSVDFWTSLPYINYYCTSGLVTNQPSDVGMIQIIRNNENMAILWISLSDATQWVKTIYNGVASSWRSTGATTASPFPVVVSTLGSSTEYIATDPNVASVTNGTTIAVKFHTDSGEFPMLNLNGTGSKPIQVVPRNTFTCRIFPSTICSFTTVCNR